MSNITLASTTSSQEELDHAAGENWREPFVPKSAEEAAPVEEVAAEPEVKVEEKPAPKNHKGGGTDKRIGKLTAMNAALSKELEELRAKVKPAEEKQESTAPREPKLADFGNDMEKWIAARDAWKENEQTRVAQESTQKEIFDNYNKRVSEARGEYDDWDEVIGAADKIVIPNAAKIAIIESDNGPDIGYYLAKHPEEAAAMMDMTSTHAIHVAVGKISDKLLGEKAKPAVKEKVRPPAPVTPVGSSAARTNIPLEEMPIRDYIKVRNKQEREHRGR